MYKNKKILSLIPARGGSKGLARKNLRLLCGKPLVAWTIEEALKSNYIDKVVVTTDDKRIASVAKRYGAEVPFMRPKHLAGDTAKMYDAILHALNFFGRAKEDFDILLLLQPTSPLRNAGDIDKAIELLFSRNAGAIVSVCRVKHHPLRSNTLPQDGCMKGFVRCNTMHQNRQDLPEYYRLNGALYLAHLSYFKKRKDFFGSRTFAYLMPFERSVDIDNQIDMQLAEILMQS